MSFSAPILGSVAVRYWEDERVWKWVRKLWGVWTVDEKWVDKKKLMEEWGVRWKGQMVVMMLVCWWCWEKEVRNTVGKEEVGESREMVPWQGQTQLLTPCSHWARHPFIFQTLHNHQTHISSFFQTEPTFPSIFQAPFPRLVHQLHHPSQAYYVFFSSSKWKKMKQKMCVFLATQIDDNCQKECYFMVCLVTTTS